MSLQGSQRDSLDRIHAKNSDVPGPGYYNSRSVFDLPEAGGGGSYNDTDFLMQLNAARKRQSSVFESRTQRDSMLKGISKRRNEPGTSDHKTESSRLFLTLCFVGPGAYDLPPDIRTQSKPADKQFFASSGARFQDVSNLIFIRYGSVCK
jgi:hypothetical protein